jgi:hypothetical protein
MRESKMCTITNKYQHTKDVALAFARATLLVLINVHVSLEKKYENKSFEQKHSYFSVI